MKFEIMKCLICYYCNLLKLEIAIISHFKSQFKVKCSIKTNYCCTKLDRITKCEPVFPLKCAKVKVECVTISSLSRSVNSKILIVLFTLESNNMNKSIVSCSSFSTSSLPSSMYIQYKNVFLGIYMIYLFLHCECQLHD